MITQREIVICNEVITTEEMQKLTLSQIMILCAFRCLRTSQQVANFLKRSEKSIQMHLIRIKEAGVEL